MLVLIPAGLLCISLWYPMYQNFKFVGKIHNQTILLFVEFKEFLSHLRIYPSISNSDQTPKLQSEKPKLKLKNFDYQNKHLFLLKILNTLNLA